MLAPLEGFRASGPEIFGNVSRQQYLLQINLILPSYFNTLQSTLKAHHSVPLDTTFTAFKINIM